MVMARRTLENFWRREAFPRCLFLAVCLGSLIAVGCGDTAKTVVAPATGNINGYFGGPFVGSAVDVSESSFDHQGNSLAVSGFAVNHSAQVPVNIINGTFTLADTGFLAITENFAPTSAGALTPQNPPLTGAWAVEIGGAGALANLLSSSTATTEVAAPTVMTENATCPSAPGTPVNYVYVTVPKAGNQPDIADYGVVGVTTSGADVTFTAQPYLIGAQAQAMSTVTGGCSITNVGALTAYPLNSFGSASNLELIAFGRAGLLVSSYNAGPAITPGAFGGSLGVAGVAEPNAPVSASALAGLQFNGFIYSPDNTAQQPTYDITTLASAFGNHQGSAPECSALQASLAANNGAGNGLITTLPSANAIYGGSFISATGANDPSGASGSETCNVAIDFGTAESSINGLFPAATIYIGSTFPPFSSTNPWNCPGAGTCAVSFPAAAVVGQVLGKYVVFISASAVSSPPSQLPDTSATLAAQPVGIYLFQK
jgi:hypothetical protein